MRQETLDKYQKIAEQIFRDNPQATPEEVSFFLLKDVKAGFDPDQVRDENGRWSAKPGGGSGKCSFKNWFKNSKAVDENGDPQTFYHGTTHEFDEFSEERGNIENDFGIGFYFSSSYEDVASNYDEIGPDLTQRIEQLTEELVNNYENEGEDLEWDDARELATERLHGGVSKIIPVYLSLQNPVILGGKNETWFDYEENYDEETDYYDEPTGLAVDFMEALRIEGSDYYDYDHAKIQESIGEWYGGAGATSILTALRQSEGIAYIQDENTGRLAGNQLIRKALERMGFDGIIDNNVFNKFGGNRQFGQPMTGIRPDTAHAIAFKPNQIKSTDAESYCTETGNIYKYFLELFTKAGFNPDQTRDEDGKWADQWADMRFFESVIKNDKTESAKVYDKDGNEIFYQQGDEAQIRFTNQQQRDALNKGFVLTHNHPEGKSFSFNDILLLNSWSLNEVRAVGSKWTYSMKYLPVIDRSTEEASIELVDRFDKIMAALKKSKKAAKSKTDSWFYAIKDPTDSDVDKANMQVTWETMDYFVNRTRIGKKYFKYSKKLTE